MDILKKIFPLSYRFSGNIISLIIGIVIYLVVIGFLASLVFGILSGITILQGIIGAISSVLGLYCVAGVVIQLLVFFNILK